MKNTISWFSIPAEDFDRAKKFYEALYEKELQVMENDGDTMLMLPGDMENGVAGSITKGPGRTPTKDGTLVYLNFEGDLQKVLDRAVEAGAEIKTPKTAIKPDMGFYAEVIDVEGNRIGVWSQE